MSYLHKQLTQSSLELIKLADKRADYGYSDTLAKLGNP